MMTALATELWFDWSIDLWPLVTGLLVGVSCGLLGAVFLVRRAALLGDAVSHSVLPGVAGGLLVAGWLVSEREAFGASVSMIFVLVGALLAGIASTALIEALHRYSRVKEDTALGAVFSAFFAVGVILIDVAARGVHFDIDCVFYGSLENVDRARHAAPLALSCALVLVFASIAYKEILLSSFDRTLARSLGMRVRWIDRALVVLLAATVVSAFEAVGAILVVAFLVIPPATARLLTDRFSTLLLLSALLGASAALLGAWLTILLAVEPIGLETSRAPSMALCAAFEFAAVLAFSPRRGVIAQGLRRRALEARIVDENVLGAIFRLGHAEPVASGPGAVAESPAATVERAAETVGYAVSATRRSVARCARRGELETLASGTLALTAAGRRRVESLIRAHRLWESWMIAELGAAADHVHDAADQIEHHLQPALVRDLDALLGFPRVDPHGQRIPGIDAPPSP